MRQYIFALLHFGPSGSLWAISTLVVVGHQAFILSSIVGAYIRATYVLWNIPPRPSSQLSLKSPHNTSTAPSSRVFSSSDVSPDPASPRS